MQADKSVLCAQAAGASKALNSSALMTAAPKKALVHGLDRLDVMKESP
jgi:hypothetical protein